MPIRLLCGNVERPDFHCGDAFVQKRLSKLPGTTEEVTQIIETRNCARIFTPETPISARLSLRAAHVLSARTSVVGTDAFACPTPEKLNQRLTRSLPEQIP